MLHLSLIEGGGTFHKPDMCHNRLTLLAQVRDPNLVIYMRDLAYCVNEIGQVLEIFSSEDDGQPTVNKGLLHVIGIYLQ